MLALSHGVLSIWCSWVSVALSYIFLSEHCVIVDPGGSCVSNGFGIIFGSDSDVTFYDFFNKTTISKYDPTWSIYADPLLTVW